MSYFASSAAPDMVEWQEEKPIHLMSTSLVDSFAQAANDALYEVKQEVRELCVTTEHTMESICDELGIHPFHHNFFGSLAGTTLTLYSNGHLEIRRE